MILILLGLACTEPTVLDEGTAFTLSVDVTLASNQSGLLDELDELELRIEYATGTEAYPLSTTEPGSSGEVVGIDPLEAETVSLVGYQGGAVVAFGRSLSLTVSEDELSTSLLLLRTDDFVWLDTPGRRALAGAVATGDGEFWIAGGIGGTDAFDGSGEFTWDDWWTLSVTGATDLAVTEVPELVVPSLEAEPDIYAASSEGRLNHGMTLLSDGSVLITGGGQDVLSGMSTSNGAYLWRPGDSSMSVADSMKRHRAFHNALVLPSGDAVMIGGLGDQDVANSFTFNNDFDYYDVSDGEFKQPRDLLSVGGYGSAGTSLREDGALVCGGLGLNNGAGFVMSSGCDLIGLDRTIEVETPLPVGVVHHRMVTLPSGQVLLTGGIMGAPDSVLPNDFATIPASSSVYRFESGSWTEVAPMHNPRALHSAALLPDGRVLVVGGAASIDGVIYLRYAQGLPCAEIYDPAADTWTEVDSGCSASSATGSIHAAAWGMSLAVDNDYGALVVGGVEYASPVEGASLFVGKPEL